MKTMLLLLGVLALSACTNTVTKTVYLYEPRPKVVEPQTQPVRMRPVEWKVVTKPELEKILADLEQNPDPNFALFALTPKGYENLSTNLVEINRYMREQNQVVLYYRGYVRDTVVPTQPKAK